MQANRNFQEFLTRPLATAKQCEKYGLHLKNCSSLAAEALHAIPPSGFAQVPGELRRSLVSSDARNGGLLGLCLMR